MMIQQSCVVSDIYIYIKKKEDIERKKCLLAEGMKFKMVAGHNNDGKYILFHFKE